MVDIAQVREVSINFGWFFNDLEVMSDLHQLQHQGANITRWYHCYSWSNLSS